MKPLFYRTYDRTWSRTGWATVPHFPGQAGCHHDFPLRCECGAAFVRVLSSRNLGLAGLDSAQCLNGHETPTRPVSEMVGS